MIRPVSTLRRLRSPIRRVAALDPGHRCLKLLLAESDFGRLRILKQELIDLKAEGLVSAEEIKTHLLPTLASWGSPPLALVLHQHLSISQVIDLPLAPDSEVQKLIEDESIRLSGVSESRIVYDFVRIETPAKDRQQFWVTLAQEGDIRERILSLGLEQEDLCEVTTTANALVAAYQATHPLSSQAILVHMGALITVVVVLLAGQGAFATSFQMGGDFLTRSLARARNCSEEIAEDIKRKTNLFSGPQADAQFAEAVDGWVAELKRQLKAWFEKNPAAAAAGSRFEIVASGGAFDEPGLLEYLRSRAEINLRPWATGESSEVVLPAKGFEVAFGAGLQALGHSPQPVSLLPEDYQVAWQKRLSRQRLDFASFLLVLTCVLVFAIGVWHNLSLINRKEALLAKAQAGQEAVEANDALTAELVAEYENLRPLFAAQQNTLDTLNTLSLLQHSRSNRICWYVAVADQNSYFSQPPGLTSTNRPVRTNLTAGSTANGGLSSALFGPSVTAFTARPGLIAELCIPGEAEAARKLLSQMVGELQRQRLFSKVDLLSEDLRRGLADPKVVIPDRQFVLALDFAETDFQKPALPRRPAGAFPSRQRKRGSRPSLTVPDNPENVSQSAK